MAPPTEAPSGDPGVDLDPPRSLTTLRLQVDNRLAATAVNAVAIASGFATTTKAATADFVVSDRIECDGSSRTILLIDPTPAHAKAAVTAIVEGKVCSVLSTSMIEHLTDAIWAARNGLALIPDEVLQMAREAPSVDERHERILRNLAEGLSNKQIATREHVSIATVKRDLSTLFRLFDCGSRLELISRAATLGYINRRR